MDFIPCRKCTKGWIYNNEEVEKCFCLSRYQEKLEKEANIQRSNLPIQIEDYNFDKYIGPDDNGNIPKLKKYVDEFESKYKTIHLFCSGTNGTQKTTLVSYIGSELAFRNFDVYYSTMNDIVKNLTAVQFKEELQEKIDKYSSCDLLIIDEAFDLTKLQLYQSGYQVSFIDSFLRERLERLKRATIFISNISLQSIDIKFGMSLKSLIERNCKNTQLEFKDSINLKNEFEVNKLWE